MDKKKGDKDERGSYYKVDLKGVSPITADNEIMQQFDRLARYKASNENFIKKHNHLVKVREVAATIPDEYLRSVRLDSLINVDDTRRLIIKGCDAEIAEIAIELNKMTKHFKKHQV